MKYATDSHVAMLKGAIALAWSDLSLSEKEVELVRHYIERNINLSAEQKTALLAEVKQPHKVAEIWPNITDKMDRAHLLNIAYMIFWQDGVFCHTEREAFDRMEKEHLATLNVAVMEKEIKDMCADAINKIKTEERAFIDNLSAPARFVYSLENIITKI